MWVLWGPQQLSVTCTGRQPRRVHTSSLVQAVALCSRIQLPASCSEGATGAMRPVWQRTWFRTLAVNQLRDSSLAVLKLDSEAWPCACRNVPVYLSISKPLCTPPGRPWQRLLPTGQWGSRTRDSPWVMFSSLPIARLQTRPRTLGGIPCHQSSRTFLELHLGRKASTSDLCPHKAKGHTEAPLALIPLVAENALQPKSEAAASG